MPLVDFLPYAYRAWACPLSTSGPWEAWYEIHTPDHQTLLFGPTKLPGQFVTGDDAVAEAEAKVQCEIRHSIGGQTKPQWTR
jgi:hypothetical protein